MMNNDVINAEMEAIAKEKAEKVKKILLLTAIIIFSWLTGHALYRYYDAHFEVKTGYRLVEVNGERKIESFRKIVRKPRNDR